MWLTGSRPRDEYGENETAKQICEKYDKKEKKRKKANGDRKTNRVEGMRHNVTKGK